jgi:hypothetical protein
MISKNTFLLSPNKQLIFFMLLVFSSTVSLFAQTIFPQKLPFNKICAGGPHPVRPGEIFNEYQVFFKTSGFDPSVTFVVELSDAAGSFTTPTATTLLPPLTDTPPDTATDKTITFAVPTNLVGSNLYQLRVKPSVGNPSSSFIINGSGSTKSFTAYFKAYIGPFLINNNKSTVSFCNGSSVTITVYNPTQSSPDSSPANYPQLKYNWYKDNVLIPGQNGTSLSVSSVGEYYAELDYGLCTDGNYSSQRVTVSGSTGGTATISSNLGNPFCPDSGKTTLTATTGNSYIWKKDNAVIDGERAETYQTNVSGVYTCDVDFGGCISTGTIDLKVSEITSTISGIDVDQINYIQEGETLNVATTTSATAPSYQWFLGDGAISGATQSTLDITAAGKYKVIITQTTGCVVTNEFLFEVAYKEAYDGKNIPNILTAGRTWIIPEIYTNGKAKVMVLSSSGEMVYPLDGNYDYNNDVGWPQTPIDFKSFNPVYYYIITPSGQSAKKGSITVFK